MSTNESKQALQREWWLLCDLLNESAANILMFHAQSGYISHNIAY